MNRYRLSERAKADFDTIVDYIGIECDNPAAAFKQVDAIHESLAIICTQPQMGQQRDDLRPRLRTFSVGNYVILYYPIADGIEVAGIVHGARDIEGLFQRGER